MLFPTVSAIRASEPELTWASRSRVSDPYCSAMIDATSSPVLAVYRVRGMYTSTHEE